MVVKNNDSINKLKYYSVIVAEFIMHNRDVKQELITLDSLPTTLALYKTGKVLEFNRS